MLDRGETRSHLSRPGTGHFRLVMKAAIIASALQVQQEISDCGFGLMDPFWPQRHGDTEKTLSLCLRASVAKSVLFPPSLILNSLWLCG